MGHSGGLTAYSSRKRMRPTNTARVALPACPRRSPNFLTATFSRSTRASSYRHSPPWWSRPINSGRLSGCLEIPSTAESSAANRWRTGLIAASSLFPVSAFARTAAALARFLRTSGMRSPFGSRPSSVTDAAIGRYVSREMGMTSPCGSDSRRMLPGSEAGDRRTRDLRRRVCRGTAFRLGRVACALRY